MKITMKFGKHKGKTLDQIPVDYLRWLINPEGKRSVIDPKIIQAATLIVQEDQVRAESVKRVEKILAGHETGYNHPVYIIETNDSNSYDPSEVNQKIFMTFDEAIEALCDEYPIEDKVEEDGVEIQERSTPDPEDDMIQIFEVLPTGHKKPVWGFYGWHHTHDEEHSPCGQGTLPGDTETLYSLAMRSY